MNSGEFVFQADAQALSHVRMRLWGDFSVTDSMGKVITPRGRKARALLAWLALHPGRPISRERICGLLWGNRAEEQARASLRQTLFELKPFTIGPEPLLHVGRSHISLDPNRLQTDLDGLDDAARCQDGAAFARLHPDHGEHFLNNLNDIDSSFDDWLAIERTRQRDRLEALGPVAAPILSERAFAPPAAPVPPSSTTSELPRTRLFRPHILLLTLPHSSTARPWLLRHRAMPCSIGTSSCSAPATTPARPAPQRSSM